MCAQMSGYVFVDEDAEFVNPSRKLARHSMVNPKQSSLKNRTNANREPLKRRVSFSREKSIQLISKDKKWPVPDIFRDCFRGEENANAKLPSLQSAVLEDIGYDEDDYDQVQDGNDTMDLTADFSARFQFNANDNHKNDLSSLIENDFDYSLPLLTINNTGSSGETSSEITFLGGKPIESKGYNSANNTADILDMMDDDRTLDINQGDVSMNFSILANLSQKIETSRMSQGGSFASLVQADSLTEMTEKAIMDACKSAEEEDGEKTELFLLDNTETLLCAPETPKLGRSMSNMENELLLRKARDIDGPLTVEEYLSRVHIHFRIFDSVHKNSICIVPASDNDLALCDILVALLQQNLLVAPRLDLLERKNTQYEEHIKAIKKKIADLEEILSVTNPQCFTSNALSHKVLKQLRKQVQVFSKHYWLKDRVTVQETLKSQFTNTISRLEKQILAIEQQLQFTTATDNLTANDFAFLDDIVTFDINQNPSSADFARIKQLELDVSDKAEEYDVLSNIPQWSLSNVKDASHLSFTFFDHQLHIQLNKDESLVSTFTRARHSVYAKLQDSLIENLAIDRYLSTSVHHIKQIPDALDEISLRMGRMNDIIVECMTINAMSENVSVLFDGDQITGSLTSLQVSLAGFVITVSIDAKTYPFANLTYTFDSKVLSEERKQAVSKAMLQFRPPAYTYGRLEVFFQYLHSEWFSV